ncbi:aspartic peptidase domain-containing protein [Mycena leptocephala]|nr:aspartic peptidase domain-containing protein [Mycena leptocephala]
MLGGFSTLEVHLSLEPCASVKYADGSFAEYELWNDYVYLHPYWAPPPAGEPYKPWLHLTFGVTSKISALFKNAPTSGILGLGRRSVIDNRLTRPPTFLQQIRPLLDSPEMTILLARTSGFVLMSSPSNVIMTTNRYITFGRRPVFDNAPNVGHWHNYIPILGDEHWKFASNTKKLNGQVYKYNNGTAELDTGAAFCYLDDKFVKEYYAQIPGSTTKHLGAESEERLCHLIPVTMNATPRVELDIGGYFFTLERSHLPQAATQRVGATRYYVGALQPKSLLTGPGGVDNAPDLIGRVALVNMEIVLQMPDNKPHTMSWRRKDTDFTGPSTQQW